jgi:hypothetical protein
MIDELCHDTKMFDKLNIVLLMKEKFEEISDHLNEKSLRIWCATEAKNYNNTYGSTSSLNRYGQN